MSPPPPAAPAGQSKPEPGPGRSESTRRLSIGLFSDIGFLELARQKYEEGDNNAAGDWFVKFIKLNAFRHLPGKDKLRVLTQFFLDLLEEGQYGLITLLARRLKLEDRALYDVVAVPLSMAADHFQRTVKGRKPSRTEVLAAMRRIRPNLPLPEDAK